MSRALGTLIAGLALAASPQAGVETDPDSQEPSRWRHNPRSRTEIAIERQNEGDLDAAGTAFGEALELAPGDPLVQFNAGTADLLRDGAQAVDLLRSAAEVAPPELRPLAYYNLGNAQMGAQALPEAIESFKQSLRLDPGFVDAKHNLELAQRLLEQQQQQEQQQEQQQNQDQEQQPQDQQQDQEQDQQQQQEQEQQPDEQQQQQEQDSPLPEFEDQPDMSAEQAAAILEAVENLEREQRQKQAMEQLKRSKGDRDW